MPLNKSILSPYKKGIFIETGTYVGEGIKVALDVGFKKIYSIEIDKDYFEENLKRFENNKKVNLIKGDSRKKLLGILRQIQEPATIWLDAHTAFDTPIIEELKALQRCPIKDHTILIDDIKDIKNSYKINLKDLTKKIKEINPDYNIEFIDSSRYAKNILLAQTRKKRILYIDHFSYTNTSAYWLKAFKKFGKVKTFEIKENKDLFKEITMNFKPDHIHLGGSVKNGIIPPDSLSDIKKETECTISAIYGDASYSVYHSELSKIVDYIYLTNKTHIKMNKEKGLKNFKYLPCPTDPEIFKSYKLPKLYDVIFIGNNYQTSRLPLLKKLSELFDLKVFGFGWKGTDLDFGKPVFGRDFSKACSRSKISIGIIDDNWVDLEAYFSNRLINTLATGCFFISRYTPGMEKVFTNNKHLMEYTEEKELIKLIKYYLANEKEREKIALAGQKEVYKKYTYNNCVKKILKDSKWIK